VGGFEAVAVGAEGRKCLLEAILAELFVIDHKKYYF
jgi:hypothetical protein